MYTDELTDIDYRILEFVGSNEPVHIDAMKIHFPDVISLEYRIEMLNTSQIHKLPYGVQRAISNTSFLSQEYEDVIDDSGAIRYSEGLHIYSLTDLGRKALQDYKGNTIKARKEMWLKNAWIPILVSLATNLLLDGLKWLFPLLQGWLASILG